MLTLTKTKNIERDDIMDTKKEFQARVNPVYTTGKGTAGCLAQAGNIDAAASVGRMDLSELSSKGNEVPEIIKKGYAVALKQDMKSAMR